MNSRPKTISGILLFCTLCLASCSDTANKSSEASEPKKQVKKGRIWDKVNIVQIPLTAEEYPLRGKVKTVDYKDYELVEKDGKQDTVLSAYGHNGYDEAGHLVDQKEYDKDGKMKWDCTYTYTADNKRKEWHFIFPDRESRTVFTYDAKGNLVEETETDLRTKEVSKTINKYDEQGNKTESTSYDAKGKITGVSTANMMLMVTKQNLLKKEMKASIGTK